MTTSSSRRHLPVSLLAGALLLSPTLPVLAADYPDHPVTIVSPYNPGGTNDVVARLLAEGLQRRLGQTFIVENRAGAAGVIGSSHVMRAKPDGYTLLFANNGALVVQPVVKSPVPYDPTTAFTPVVKAVDAANFIGVSSDLKVESVGELIELFKQNPGKYNYSSSGSGSFGNFTGEYFKLVTDTDVMHVPAKGSAAALTELMAGRIQMMIDPLVLSQRGSDRIRILATTNEPRVSFYPDIPTITESGGPEIDLMGWFGLFAPADLPRDISDKLEQAVRETLAEPQAQEILASAGLIVAPEGRDDFAKRVASDLARYTDIRERAGMAVVE